MEALAGIVGVWAVSAALRLRFVIAPGARIARSISKDFLTDILSKLMPRVGRVTHIIKDGVKERFSDSETSLIKWCELLQRPPHSP